MVSQSCIVTDLTPARTTFLAAFEEGKERIYTMNVQVVNMSAWKPRACDIMLYVMGYCAVFYTVLWGIVLYLYCIMGYYGCRQE